MINYLKINLFLELIPQEFTRNQNETSPQIFVS